MPGFQTGKALKIPRTANFSDKNTFRWTNFTTSILFYRSARPVIQSLGTIFDADKIILRQSTLITSGTAGKSLFQEIIPPGPLLVGFGEKKLFNLIQKFLLP